MPGRVLRRGPHVRAFRPACAVEAKQALLEVLADHFVAWRDAAACARPLAACIR
jgi:hypothetical protein